MDPFRDRPSEMERVQMREENDYFYDDDDDGLAAASVSDGFRPSHVPPAASSILPSPSPSPSPSPFSLQPHSQSRSQSQSQSQSQSHSHAPHQQSSATTSDFPSHQWQQVPGSLDSALERRSSITKHRRPSDSQALGHDAPRALSDTPQFRPQSPYRGPSAPSHPYQSYLQRTLSNATASTGPLPLDNSSPYDAPHAHAPAHPYAQYSQSIPHGGETTPQQQQQQQQQYIPLDLPGAGSIDPYRRQLGPDGEEVGGLIGPLGHTEELPPYSRYPNQTFTIKLGPDPLLDPQPLDAVPPRRPSGAAAQNQNLSPAAEGDMEPIRSRISTESRHEINTAAREVAEKPRLNKWQRRAKRKLCGIVPCWAICLVLIAVVLIGLVLGAVIGTVLSHSNGNHGDFGSDDGFFTITPSDVVPITQYPHGLPPPAVGQWTLPLAAAAQHPADCVADPSLAPSWSCDLSRSAQQLTVDKTPSKNDTRNYNLTLATTPADEELRTLVWGAQPFTNMSLQLMLVEDAFDGRLGPAWWTTFSHDKAVLLPGYSLTPPGEKSKRTLSRDQPRDIDPVYAPPPPPPQHESDAAPPRDGDVCWMCTWPDVTVEVFIFPGQGVPNSTAGPADSSSSSTTTAAAGPTPSQATSGSSIAYGSPAPSRSTSGPAMAPSSPSAAQPSASDAPTFINAHRFDGTSPPPPLMPRDNTSPRPLIPRSSDHTSSLPSSSSSSIYPNAVKIVERRTYSPAFKASCQQVVITNGARGFAVLLHDDNSPIEMDVPENAPSLTAGHERIAWHGIGEGGGSGRSGRSEREEQARGVAELTDCACLWWA